MVLYRKKNHSWTWNSSPGNNPPAPDPVPPDSAKTVAPEATSGDAAPGAGRKRVASPAVALTSPPIVQDPKKGKCEPEQEPAEVEVNATPSQTMLDANDDDDEEESTHTPTPKRSLTKEFDDASELTPLPTLKAKWSPITDTFVPCLQ